MYLMIIFLLKTSPDKMYYVLLFRQILKMSFVIDFLLTESPEKIPYDSFLTETNPEKVSYVNSTIEINLKKSSL